MWTFRPFQYFAVANNVAIYSYVDCGVWGGCFLFLWGFLSFEVSFQAIPRSTAAGAKVNAFGVWLDSVQFPPWLGRGFAFPSAVSTPSPMEGVVKVWEFSPL